MAEQEAKVRLLFKQLEAGFKQLEKITDDAKSEKKLKELVELIKDVKGAVKEYEREAKVDGVDAAEIKATRSDMVNTVNKYVSMKKEYSNRSAARAELMAGPSKPAQVREEDMTNQEIMQAGRNKMKDIDDGLARAVRVVHDTEQVGTQAAQKLKAQTDQMNKIIDDLNEIDFTMQKASKVLRDITRGLLTDKCIMCLLFLVVAAIATAIGLKIAGVGDKSIRLPGTDRGQSPSPLAPPPPGTQGRRLLETPYNRFMSRKMLLGFTNVAHSYN